MIGGADVAAAIPRKFRAFSKAAEAGTTAGHSDFATCPIE
jgi:hypothetical protein